MTALIIEDEIPAGKRLEKLLVQKGFTILQIVHSVSGAVKWFAENSEPDIIFMDIRLRDGLCFAIFDKVSLKSKIVFTTAYDEFALKAFEYNSVDYLLKPIDVAKLDKLIAKIDLFATDNSDYQNLEQTFEKTYINSFLIPLGNTIKKLECRDILYFVSNDNMTFAFTNSSRTYPIKESLEKLETSLNGGDFFRISRKHIVNRNAIISISNEGFLQINIPSVSEVLIVSRLRTKAFLNWYKK
jgi:DNA-binding LytR/AlgR family response regulator